MSWWCWTDAGEGAQAGQHYVDIRSGRRGAVVVFAALFRLADAATLGSAEDEGTYVRGSVRLDFATRVVTVSFSKPRAC